jgi:predicted HD phosphohydrolase
MNDDEKAVDPTYKRDCARASHRSLQVTGDGSSAGWAASARY